MKRRLFSTTLQTYYCKPRDGLQNVQTDYH